MNVRPVALFLALFAGRTLAADYGTVQVDQVNSIYDADTFNITVNAWPAIIGKNIRVRVGSLDTPENKGECQEEVEAALLAKQATVAFLRDAKTIELRHMKRDKFFRIDAEVYADGKNLGEYLLAQGHARTYDGGKRHGWCEKLATTG